MSRFRILFAVTASIFSLVAGAASAEKPLPRKAQHAESRVAKEADEMLAAVVRVKMKAIPDARSVPSLGLNREGTGVVIDEQGHIVTIGYIVIEADSIEVTTQDNKTVPAILVGYDHATGFGLLRPSSPLGVKPMPMGQADDLAVREAVMILPAGGREAASLAYVVSKRRFSGSWEYMLDTAIFTSPPASEWAGAALVSREGKLVGIGSLLVRDTLEGTSEVPGNMFVPIDLLKPILGDLLAKGRRSGPSRPWLGLATEELQGHLFVSRVSPEGPADKAGIRKGDIVLGVGADSVRNHEELYRRVWGLGAAGTDVPLRILQGADVREFSIHSIDRFQYFRVKPVY